MRFSTSQRPRLWILIVSCFIRVFFVFRFRVFFLFFVCFFPADFPLLFHYLWMLFFVSPFVFFWLPCLVWCVATLLQPRFFNITTKHVCKAFLQEYRIRDIRFRVLWSKQDPNAKGEDEHERNRKKTGPQRRREKRPRKKCEKITRKKCEKNGTSSNQPLKKTKNWKIKKKLEFFCVFFAFFLRFFLHFFLCFFFCVFFAFFFFSFFFCVFFVFFFAFFLLFFLLFFSPLPRGRCFCARRPWRPKSWMEFPVALGNWIWAALWLKRVQRNYFL